MIPTIETIVEDLASGAITKQQAIAWLHMHAKNAGRELRDDFAAAALSGLCANPDQSSFCYERKFSPENVREDFATSAYAMADAMLRARQS